MEHNIVLRFRDFATRTIQEHTSYIDKNGSVWWGWWNKPIEKVPNVFNYLKDNIKTNGHCWIFLLHSGMFRLYKAKVLDIDFDRNGEAKECPDIAMVPEYYYDMMCKTWFLFSEINDTNPEELNEWAYDDPDDFIQGGNPNKRQGFRISGIKEMLSVHNTMYFITPYDSQKHAESFTALKTGFDVDILVENIMELIEEIIKTCDYAPKKIISPIQYPRYPKSTERGLKRIIVDNITLRDFSSCIYKLIVDGHFQVRNKDRAIIRKDEFLQKFKTFISDVSLFRCDLHHGATQSKDKSKVGQLYKKICGTSILSDRDKMAICQESILKQTVEMLRNELSIVKEKIKQL